MPYATPIRLADPVRLEQVPVCAYIRSTANSMVIPYVNISTTLSISPGEPVLINGRVGLTSRLILPLQEGNLVFDWVADFIVSNALAANILAGDPVWWDYSDTTLASGLGAVVRAAPTNGYILGFAAVMPGAWTIVSNRAVAQDFTDARVVGNTARIRVYPSQAVVPVIGTIPTYI